MQEKRSLKKSKINKESISIVKEWLNLAKLKTSPPEVHKIMSGMSYEKPLFIQTNDNQCYIAIKTRDSSSLHNIHQYVQDKDIDGKRYTTVKFGKGKAEEIYGVYTDNPKPLINKNQKINCEHKKRGELITWAKVNLNKNE